MFSRLMTKEVAIGGVRIGGGNPVAIQSMANTDTRDYVRTSAQLNALAEAGCEIARVAVPDMEAARAIARIKERVSIPLVADIHFDYRLAVAAAENGADKLRINPGNIGGPERVRAVAAAARERGIPIRVGVNSGSLDRDLIEKYGGVTPEGLAESALRGVKLLEDLDFDDIVISVKASGVPFTLRAYRLLARQTDHPLHLGVTEAGTLSAGAVKSAVGIGALLEEGIGDTIRVSLTADPLEEIACAREILKALELRRFGVELTSCPTCGRTQTDLIAIANEVERRCRSVRKDIRVAVMGCAVNGPGEARAADVGIACGAGRAVIFKKGRVLRAVSAERAVDELMEEIKSL